MERMEKDKGWLEGFKNVLSQRNNYKLRTSTKQTVKVTTIGPNGEIKIEKVSPYSRRDNEESDLY